MKIRINENSEIVKTIREKIKANDGYCPCKLIKNEDTKCMCKEFRDQKNGMCHCGLYIKEDEE